MEQEGKRGELREICGLLPDPPPHCLSPSMVLNGKEVDGGGDVLRNFFIDL